MVSNISTQVPAPSFISRLPVASNVSKTDAVNITGAVQITRQDDKTVHEPEKSVDNTDDLNKAVSHLNDYIQSFRRDLHFSIDDGSGQVVVKVVDTQTKEVIRQIPSEDALAMARGLEKSNGMLLRAQA
ncbi:MAG: flagellar protein FlaG [Gammaproteobacteria bacterium]